MGTNSKNLAAAKDLRAVLAKHFGLPTDIALATANKMLVLAEEMTNELKTYDHQTKELFYKANQSPQPFKA